MACLCGLKSNFYIAALNGQVEAGALVLHKVQGHFGEALGLQVGDDGLPTQGAPLDHLQHLLKLVLQQRQLEDILCGVDLRISNISHRVKPWTRLPQERVGTTSAQCRDMPCRCAVLN